ncbi:MAG: hypothetical protein Kow0047_25800 [Anaerolineae bacterium]
MAYSDAEKAEALIRLALNNYNYQRTSEETGISVMTLRRWNKTVPKKGVAELLERAVERLLMAIPEDLSGRDWALALGILLDKWLLAQGQPTARSESVLRQVRDLSDDQYYAVIAEAERILAEAAGCGVVEGGVEQPDGAGPS